jgi:hypothetical protein
MVNSLNRIDRKLSIVHFSIAGSGSAMNIPVLSSHSVIIPYVADIRFHRDPSSYSLKTFLVS